MNAKRNRRVALYVRVSTDQQTIKNQERELSRNNSTISAVSRHSPRQPAPWVAPIELVPADA